MHCAPVEDAEIDGTGSNEPVCDPVMIVAGAAVNVGVGLLTIIIVVEDGAAAPYN